MGLRAKLRGLSIFSGVGGLDFSLREWVEPEAYCEIDSYAQKVLIERIKDGSLHPAGIWDDVRTLKREHVKRRIDIIVAGWPCVGISNAGNKTGIAGDTDSSLYSEVARLVEEFKPTFVFLENVPPITTRGLDIVLRSLEKMGFHTRWALVSAAETGAPHQRDRFFLAAMANTDCGGSLWPGVIDAGVFAKPSEAAVDHQREEILNDGQIPDVGTPRRSGPGSSIFKKPENKEWSNPRSWWNAKSSIRRVASRVPHRMERVRVLGNACCPKQAETAFKILMGLI